MDPNATLEIIHYRMLIRDHAVARSACRDLHEWLRKGGFEPDWSKYDGATKYYISYCQKHY